MAVDVVTPGGEQFTIDCLTIEVELLGGRIDEAIQCLHETDRGYGLTSDATAHLLRILRGETDE